MTEIPSQEYIEFGEFLKDVGAKENCPMCDHTDWLASYEPEIMTASLLLTTPGKQLTGRWFVCSNCGFFRFHSENTFEAWKENRDKGNG